MPHDPLPSKAFALWSRLGTRFELEPNPVQGPSAPEVSRTVVPVTNADELLKKIQIHTTTTAALSVGMKTVVTVPTTERWLVYGYQAVRSTGDRNINMTRVQGGGNACPIDVYSATGDRNLMFGAPFPMDRDFSFALQVASGATDSIYILNLILQIELAY